MAKSKKSLRVLLYLAMVVGIAALAGIFLRLGGLTALQQYFPTQQVQSSIEPAASPTAQVLTGEQQDLQKKYEARLVQGCLAGKDCIPSIDKPKFVSVRQAGFLKDEDEVIGLFYQNEARAYPLKIMNWHEIVNDTVGGKPVLVSFCPLCFTGIAFERVVDGEAVEFGVSGQLLNSNLVMYDRKTDSRWSQIMGEAVAGPLVGTKLKKITVSTLSWKEWLALHPDTKVLSTDTGFDRDYELYPYSDYRTTRDVYFPIEHEDRRLPEKEMVYGVVVNDKSRAYPLDELRKVLAGPGVKDEDLGTVEGEGELRDELGGRKIKIIYNARGIVSVFDEEAGEEIVAQISFWFAWAAFYPETDIFRVQ